MQKVEFDRINRIDSPWLQWARRAALTSVALALCYSILSREWVPTLPVLLMVATGSFVLAVNAVALYNRSPPTGKRAGSRLSSYLRNVPHRW
jgi:hypothetical protein